MLDKGQADEKSINIKLKGNKTTESKEVVLNKATTIDTSRDKEYRYLENSAIPIIKSRKTVGVNCNEKLINEFDESGKKLKDKMCIIDLRGNAGGSNRQGH